NTFHRTPCEHASSSLVGAEAGVADRGSCGSGRLYFFCCLASTPGAAGRRGECVEHLRALPTSIRPCFTRTVPRITDLCRCSTARFRGSG
ncbi:Os09g0246300, partial [Oryza sativa Japonica Group]